MALLTPKSWAWVAGILVTSWVLFHLNAVQTQAAFDGRQAHEYLCFQKLTGVPKQIAELNKSIDTQLKYETDVQLGHRRAIPGITMADIEQGIAADQSRIHGFNVALYALRAVKCKS